MIREAALKTQNHVKHLQRSLLGRDLYLLSTERKTQELIEKWLARIVELSETRI